MNNFNKNKSNNKNLKMIYGNNVKHIIYIEQ